MQHAANLDGMKPFMDKLRAGQHCLLVALGDSNTCNATFTAGAKQWPELLHSELRIHYGTQAVLLLNAGICGDTAQDALRRLESDVLDHRPDLTVVCLGSNDAGRLSDAEFRAALDDLLDRLAAGGSAVLLRTPTPVMELEPPPPHLWRRDDNLRAKVAVTRAIAAERGLPFVDLYAAWFDMGDRGELDIAPLMHDCVHTNAEGHRQVFRTLAPAFGLPLTLHWERA